MSKLSRILVPVDGSELANAALTFAIERAKMRRAEITVAFAVNRIAVAVSTATPYTYADPTPLLEALDAEADAVLDAAESLVERAGIAVKRAKLDGSAPSAILQYAQEAPFGAIVMGSHGRRGFERFAVGSTAEGVIRAARVPVFVVSGRVVPAPKPGPVKRALVAVDGSPSSREALDLACELAREEQSRLMLCSVVEPAPRSEELDRSVFLERESEEKAAQLLDEFRTHAALLGAKADIMLRHGDAVPEIVASAREVDADLIVMGTHGRGGIPRFILGSVAEGVLRSSPIPICTVRHR